MTRERDGRRVRVQPWNIVYPVSEGLVCYIEYWTTKWTRGVTLCGEDFRLEDDTVRVRNAEMAGTARPTCLWCVR